MYKNKKDILFLCQFFYPEYNSSATLPYDTARYLANNGFTVGALVGYPREYNKSGKVPYEENREGIEIRRLKYIQLNRISKIGRLINYFSFTAYAFLHLGKLKEYRAVIVYSNPPILPIVPIIAKKKYGTKIVFVSYDVYPEVAYASQTIKKGSIIDKLMQKINARLYSTVDSVVCLTDEMKEFLLHNRKDLTAPRAITIPNWAHERYLEVNNEAYKQFGYKDGQFVVSYFGNMGTCQNVDTMLDAARRLKDDDRIQFLIIGHGNKKEKIKRIVEAEGLRNIQMHDFLTGRAFEQAVAVSSCCIVSLEKGLIGTCAPSKYYSYLQGGKAIIAIVEKGSYLKEEVEKEKIGYGVEIGDSDALSNILIKMCETPLENKIMGERARELYENNYSFELSMRKYRTLLRRVIGQ